MPLSHPLKRLAPVAGFLAASGLLLAGPLDPPAGPVTSTGKTLTETTPFSPTSGPAQRLFQEHPAESKFLAAKPKSGN